MDRDLKHPWTPCDRRTFLRTLGLLGFVSPLLASCAHAPLSLADARRSVSRFVDHYNEVRLHGALGYVTPKDKLEGREAEIFAERDRRLETAHERRPLSRQQACDKAVT